MLFVTGAHMGLKGPFRQRGLLGVRLADLNETASLGERCGAVKKVWDVQRRDGIMPNADVKLK